jgi:hypothetical protein
VQAGRADTRVDTLSNYGACSVQGGAYFHVRDLNQLGHLTVARLGGVVRDLNSFGMTTLVHPCNAKLQFVVVGPGSIFSVEDGKWRADKVQNDGTLKLLRCVLNFGGETTFESSGQVIGSEPLVVSGCKVCPHIDVCELPAS